MPLFRCGYEGTNYNYDNPRINITSFTAQATDAGYGGGANHGAYVNTSIVFPILPTDTHVELNCSQAYLRNASGANIGSRYTGSVSIDLSSITSDKVTSVYVELSGTGTGVANVSVTRNGYIKIY